MTATLESVERPFLGAPMANRVTVWWQGQEYEAVRQDGDEIGAGTGFVWQLLHGGAPVTSFASEPGEAAATVKEKIFEWLEANRSRPALDIGRQ
jgi:hypothetical protein